MEAVGRNARDGSGRPECESIAVRVAARGVDLGLDCERGATIGLTCPGTVSGARRCIGRGVCEQIHACSLSHVDLPTLACGECPKLHLMNPDKGMNSSVASLKCCAHVRSGRAPSYTTARVQQQRTYNMFVVPLCFIATVACPTCYTYHQEESNGRTSRDRSSGSTALVADRIVPVGRRNINSLASTRPSGTHNVPEPR